MRDSKIKKKKLQLNRESLRHLNQTELAQAAGGNKTFTSEIVIFSCRADSLILTACINCQSISFCPICWPQ